MTIAPRKPNQTRGVFSAYDLEWYPKTQQFRMAGVFDGESYTCYYSMAHFLVDQLVPKNFGRVFYGHNAGKSDLHFVLHELLQTGLVSNEGIYEMDCAFNGSSAFLCHLRMRDNPKNGFIFADSLFLLRSSLKKIGEMIGFEKMDLDSFETENWNELRDYNERDCRVLYKAMRDLETELFELQGEMKLTLASSAMALFQTAYLSAELVTNPAINALARQSYYASRVEVFTRTCEKGLYYDVNSSFPWSMMQSLPGRYIGRTKKAINKPSAKASRFIAECTITIKDCYLPPAPIRDLDNRILFPTGRWRGTFTDVDLRLIEQEGHQVNTVHWVDWFEEFMDLGAYVLDIYERKAKAKGFKREVYKLLLNALYGKFAEMETKQKLFVYPTSLACPHKPEHPQSSCWKALPMLGLYTREDQYDLKHVHVPISAFVTAYSRGLLYRCLGRCKEIYYTDTDSIVCGSEDIFPLSQATKDVVGFVGSEIGQLKLEHVIHKGHFAAPKLYMLDATSGDDVPTGALPSLWWDNVGDRRVVVKSKGFSKLEGVKYEQLIAGEPVTLARMAGIKENIHNQNTRPKEILVAKFARFKRTKRADDGTQGATRPWTVKELVDGGCLPASVAKG